MSTATKQIEELANTEYKYGFVTDTEQDIIPVGLNEDVVRLISSKKGEPEWMLEWRLKAFRAWLNTRSMGSSARSAWSSARVESRLASLTNTISKLRPLKASAISRARGPAAPASSWTGTTMETSGVMRR